MQDWQIASSQIKKHPLNLKDMVNLQEQLKYDNLINNISLSQMNNLNRYMF